MHPNCIITCDIKRHKKDKRHIACHSWGKGKLDKGCFAQLMFWRFQTAFEGRHQICRELICSATYSLPSKAVAPFPSPTVSPLVCFIASLPAKQDKPREQQHPLTGLARPSLTLQGKKAPKHPWMIQKWEGFGFVLFCIFIEDSCCFLLFELLRYMLIGSFCTTKPALSFNPKAKHHHLSPTTAAWASLLQPHPN